MRMRKKDKKRILLFLAAAAVLLILACFVRRADTGRTAGPGRSGQTQDARSEYGESGLKVHFLDVGQADCSLIESDGHYMLIDAGNNDDAGMITSYLNKLGVKELDYVMATHPHEDHVGAMDTVIEEFEVGAVLMTDVDYDTASFRDVKRAVREKGLDVTVLSPGAEYTLGEAEFTVILPEGEYEGLNDTSAGILLEDGPVSFLFCGDAEKAAERELAASGLNLEADVYQVNHHGSNTSTTEEFLTAVDPDYAVISCGRDNDYGNPSGKVLARLSAQGTKVYRTDRQGTIVASVRDGGVEFETEGVKDTASKAQSAREALGVTYVLNTKSMKFHRPDCAGVSGMKPHNREDAGAGREEIMEMGYSPCKTCRP